MGYQWVQIKQNFDRTLAFTKVRWATGATWYDGFFSELPNINCDGQAWNSIQSAQWGYAGYYTQNLGNKKFFEKTGTTSYATRSMSSPTCTLTDDNLTPVSWEYEYQVPLYWGGISTNNYTSFNGGTGLYVYVSLTTFETDIDSISASYSGISSSVTITADSDLAWTASTSDSWISITNPTGSGNGSFTVVVSANSERSAKTGTVTVTSSKSDVLTISVSQEKMPFLFSQKPLYRNGDSVVKMYRSGALIYLKVSPSPQYEAMLYYNGDALTGTSIGNRSDVTVASTDTSTSFDVEMADQNTPWAISDGAIVLASGTGSTSNVSCTIYPTNPVFMSTIFHLQYKKDGDGDSSWQWTGEASYFQFTTE